MLSAATHGHHLAIQVMLQAVNTEADKKALLTQKGHDQRTALNLAAHECHHAAFQVMIQSLGPGANRLDLFMHKNSGGITLLDSVGWLFHRPLFRAILLSLHSETDKMDFLLRAHPNGETALLRIAIRCGLKPGEEGKQEQIKNKFFGFGRALLTTYLSYYTVLYDF